MFATVINALATTVIGVYTANKAAGLATDYVVQWVKLILSLCGTILVVSPTVMGGTIWAVYTLGVPQAGVAAQSWSAALVLGFADGLLATGASVGFLWTRSKLTRGIPICWPMKVSEEIAKVPGFSYIEPAEPQKGYEVRPTR